MLSQSLMVIMTSSSAAYFNDETSHKPENLHCWFWSHSNLSVLLVWKILFIFIPQSNKNFVYAQCLRFEKRCEVRVLLGCSTTDFHKHYKTTKDILGVWMLPLHYWLPPFFWFYNYSYKRKGRRRVAIFK